MADRPVNEQSWLLRSEHDILPRGSNTYSALGSCMLSGHSQPRRLLVNLKRIRIPAMALFSCPSGSLGH
jgi:hypothetical protein